MAVKAVGLEEFSDLRDLTVGVELGQARKAQTDQDHCLKASVHSGEPKGIVPAERGNLGEFTVTLELVCFEWAGYGCGHSYVSVAAIVIGFGAGVRCVAKFHCHFLR